MMFAHGFYGTGLWSEITRFLVETNLTADFQMGKVGTQDTVTVEVNDSAVTGFDAAIVFVRMQFNDTPMQRQGMVFNLLLAFLIFQLAPRRIKGITDGNIGVFVCLVPAWLPADDDFLIRHGDVNADME